jgi:2-polyprenyl-3-methyl-5-hydroxy-6-metoxy-1,4-benzoquinol methylase
MYPMFWYWFKGKKVSLYMDFKKLAWKMSEQEFLQVYRELDCRATDRPTDLNQKSIDRMLAVIDPSATSLLDVACGRGEWLRIVQKEKRLQVTGCDVFDQSLTQGYSYQQGMIEALPFADNAFDVVTCNHTIEHLRDLDKAISELKRVAKKQLIIVTPRQRYFYYTMDLHLHFFPLKEDLERVIGIENSECINCGGDWCYSARI